MHEAASRHPTLAQGRASDVGYRWHTYRVTGS